jgi:hypothetical protein
MSTESLLSDWRWLVGPSYTPLLITAFGDMFLRDGLGQVYFLDLMSGDFKQVATSQDEFACLCDDKEKRRTWFLGFILTELRRELGNLSAGECFSCKIPLSLGGELEVENFKRTDLQTHYSILGQLHRQTKHLPPGTKIESIHFNPPPESP